MALSMSLLLTSASACLFALVQAGLVPANEINIGLAADPNPITTPSVSAAGEPLLRSFVSFSLELAFFPDFAGNKSVPNTFSQNLLKNLASFQGDWPDIRVGGNTQ